MFSRWYDDYVNWKQDKWRSHDQPGPVRVTYIQHRKHERGCKCGEFHVNRIKRTANKRRITMTTLELLKKARKRIGNKKRWTQRAYALAKWNKPVPVATDSRAVRWCALGALEYENIAWNSSDLDPNCLDKHLARRQPLDTTRRYVTGTKSLSQSNRIGTCRRGQ